MTMEETKTTPTAEESSGESLERGDDVCTAASQFYKGTGSVSGSDTEDDSSVTQHYYYRGTGSSGSDTDDLTSIPRVELHPPPTDNTVTTTTDVPSPQIRTTRPITRAFAVLIAAARRKVPPPREESPDGESE